MCWNSSPAARSKRGLSQRAGRIAGALLMATCAWQQVANAGNEAATVDPPVGETQAADASADPADTHSAARELTETSTLAQWRSASAPERSRLAVAIARKLLPAQATKLELATAAMEISGCLTATAKDPRLAAWTLAPTAKTCLTAPERPAK